jgi:hypothetical protein
MTSTPTLVVQGRRLSPLSAVGGTFFGANLTTTGNNDGGTTAGVNADHGHGFTTGGVNNNHQHFLSAEGSSASGANIPPYTGVRFIIKY